MNYLRAICMTLFVISVSVISTPFVCSQQPDVVILNDLIREAVENNSEIKAMHNAFRAAEEKIKQAISLQDPMLNAGYFTRNPETRVGPQIGKYGISQKFPFFGKLTLKGKVTEKDRDIAYEKYEAVVRQGHAHLYINDEKVGRIYGH